MQYIGKISRLQIASGYLKIKLCQPATLKIFDLCNCTISIFLLTQATLLSLEE
jgi:hypothetical protein